MKPLLTFLLAASCTCLFAQTREIAFKSHSGSSEHFKVAIETDFFGINKVDFGLPPPTTVEVLDSVIYITGREIIIVRKSYELGSSGKSHGAFIGFNRQKSIEHALFRYNHSLDSIKKVLVKEGIDAKVVRNIVFVGYDNKKPKVTTEPAPESKPDEVKQNIILPVSFDHHDNDGGYTPFDDKLGWMLGAILFLSLTGGWISWKLYQPRIQRA